MDTLRDTQPARGALGVRATRAVEDVSDVQTPSTVLARAARPRHRPHRLQGQLAGAVAAVAGRRGDGLLATACRRSPSLFELARVGDGHAATSTATSATPTRSRARSPTQRPEVVFHLAAQPLVRRSFARPARDVRDQRDGHRQRARGRARQTDGVRVVVNVTTDKCYENREWEWGYREDEPMGGHDPYSSSQGLRRARHDAPTGARSSPTPTARASPSARAGNVIGGGDWGEDRLVPDVMRARSRASRVASATRTRSGRGSTCSTRSAATSCSPRRCGSRPSARRLELRPGRRRRAAGRAGSSSGSSELLAGELRWELDDGPAPARGALPAARLVEGPRAPRLGAALGPRRGARRASSTWYAALRGGADMRAVTLAQIDAFASALDYAADRAHDAPTACRFCGAPLEHVFADLGMSPLANSYLHAGAARTRWSRSIRCARSSASKCFLVQLEEFETPEQIFSRLRVLLVVLDELARALPPLRRSR